MQTRTQSTLAAVFGTASEAHAAARELVTNAFAGDHIHILSERQTADGRPGRSAGYREPDLKHWLASMFGRASTSDRQHYEEVMREGKAIVGVSTPYQMVSRAAEILSHHAPLETTVSPAG